MAQIPYEPFPRVSPAGIPDDYQRGNASPDAFGGQVAQQAERFGSTVQQAGNNVFDLAAQQQGQINEALATDAETKAMLQYSDLVRKYKSMEGLAAVAARPQFIQQATQIRQQIGAGIPNPMAQKAFNTLSLRHEAMALEDINTYASGQVKAADNASAKASMDVSLARAGSYAVASNDARFTDTLRDTDFQIARIAANQGYGPDGGTGMTQDQETGAFSFDETRPEGQQAKAIVGNMVNDAHGKAWDMRIRALADDPTSGNVMTAYKVFQDNRDKIPPEYQAKISAYLAPKVRIAQVNDVSGQILGSVENEYQGTFTNPAGQTYANNMGNVKGKNGAFLNPATPQDGVILSANNLRQNYQGLTLQQIGAKWTGENPQKVADWVANVSRTSGISPNQVPDLHNLETMTSLLGGIATAEKKPSEAKVFTPDMIRNAAQEAAFDVAPNFTQGQGALFQTRADYMDANAGDILDQAESRAAQLHPDDPVFAQNVRAKVEQHINDTVRLQSHANKADMDLLFQGANGDNPPATVDQLIASSPQMRAAYERQSVANPEAMTHLEKVLTANSHGPSASYGANFYDYYRQVQSGQVTDASKLFSSVTANPDGPLTPSGLKVLKSAIDRRNTPQGQGEAGAEANFFARAHGQITFSNPNLFLQDPKGEKAFGKFMQATMPAIQAGLANGKTQADLFDPKSPDYVGKNIGNYLRNPIQRTNDQMAAQENISPEHLGQLALGNVKTPQDLKNMVAANPKLRQQATELAIKRGWIRTGTAQPVNQPPQVPFNP